MTRPLLMLPPASSLLMLPPLPRLDAQPSTEGKGSRAIRLRTRRERLAAVLCRARLAAWALLLVVFVGCGGSLQPDPPPVTQDAGDAAPVCRVIDGVSHALVYGWPDGWCDYDGTTCACHGHGVGDACPQLVASYDAACDTKGAL